MFPCGKMALMNIDIRNISIHYIDIDKLIFVIFEFSPVLVT